jgi:hypothetical protein
MADAIPATRVWQLTRPSSGPYEIGNHLSAGISRRSGRYVGAVSLGFGPDGKRTRRKVTGRTKQEVRDKLKALHAELDHGLRTSSTYTVRQAVDDWLEGGLPGRSERTHSIYREVPARSWRLTRTTASAMIIASARKPAATTNPLENPVASA